MKITIGIPTIDGKMTASLALFLASICRSKKHDFQPMCVERCQPVNFARNLVVKAFLQTGDDVLWFIDADMRPDSTTLKLLDHLESADIITGRAIAFATDSQTGEFGTLYVAAFDHRSPPKGFGSVFSLVTAPTEIIACGMACTMIHRRVFGKVPLFRQEYGPDGQALRGEDILFSNDAYQAGFKLLYVPEAQIGHEKSYDLGYIEQAMNKAYTAGVGGGQQ
jgi:GT2 family glycosyltransferase